MQETCIQILYLQIVFNRAQSSMTPPVPRVISIGPRMDASAKWNGFGEEIILWRLGTNRSKRKTNCQEKWSSWNPLSNRQRAHKNSSFLIVWRPIRGMPTKRQKWQKKSRKGTLCTCEGTTFRSKLFVVSAIEDTNSKNWLRPERRQTTIYFYFP